MQAKGFWVPLWGAVFLLVGLSHGAMGSECRHVGDACVTEGGQPGICRTQTEDLNGQITAVLACEPQNLPDPFVTGIVTPKYMVMFIMYSPPGTAGSCCARSYVAYQQGSSVGTQVSATNSFNQSYSVSAKSSAGPLVSGGVEVSASVGALAGQTDTVSVQTTKTFAYAFQGGTKDGLDQYRDEIWLMLSPAIRVEMNHSSSKWSFEPSIKTRVVKISVRDLLNPDGMSPQLKDLLAEYHMSKADYDEILKVHPIKKESIEASSQRYEFVSSFPYTPPYAEGDLPSTMSYSLDTVTSQAQTIFRANDYSVDVAVENKVGFSSLFQNSLKVSGKWTWSSQSSQTYSSANMAGASVTIGGPSYEYRGAIDLDVYRDRLYNTYAFVLRNPDDATLTGVLKNSKGAPLPFREVVVTSGGRTFRTYTDAKGQYRLHSKLGDKVEVSSGRASRMLNALQGKRLVADLNTTP